MIIAIYFVIAIFTIHGFSKYKMQKLIFFVFFSFILIIFSGFRYNYGIDYLNYYKIYQYKNPVLSPEILYFNLSYFFSKILKLNYVFYIFLTAFLSIYLKSYFIYKNSENYIFALFIYCSIIFSIYDIGFIRQALAIGILGLGFYAEKLERKKAANFYYLIAFLFHSTAIIIIPIVMIGRRIKYKEIPIVLVLLITFFLGNYFMPGFLSKLAILIPNDFLMEKAQFYLKNYSGTGFSLNVIRTFIICIFLKKSENSLFKSYYYLGSIVFLLFSFNVQFATRFYSYVLLLEPVLVANRISSFKRERKIFILSASIVFYTVNFLYNVYLFNLFNYRSALELIL